MYSQRQYRVQDLNILQLEVVQSTGSKYITVRGSTDTGSKNITVRGSTEVQDLNICTIRGSTVYRI